MIAYMAQAKELALKIINREIDILEGCIRIDEIIYAHLEQRVPEDLANLFSYISSELDGVPLADAGGLWQSDFLAAKNASASRFREAIEARAMDACRRLLELPG